jgi:hypothetical protein
MVPFFLLNDFESISNSVQYSRPKAFTNDVLGIWNYRLVEIYVASQSIQAELVGVLI